MNLIRNIVLSLMLLSAVNASTGLEAMEVSASDCSSWSGGTFTSVADFKTGMCEDFLTSIDMGDGCLSKKGMKHPLLPNFVGYEKRIENERMRVYWLTNDTENKYPRMEGLLFSYTKNIGNDGGTYELPLLNDILPLEENVSFVQIFAKPVLGNNRIVLRKMFEGLPEDEAVLILTPFISELKILMLLVK